MRTKKITALVLILAILSSFIPNLVSNAASDPTVTMVLSGTTNTSTEAEVGDTVYVTFSLANGLESMKAVEADIEYDPDVLEPVADGTMNDGGIDVPYWTYTGSLTTEVSSLTTAILAEEGIIAISCGDAFLSDVATSGTFGTIGFKVLKAGTTTVSCSLLEFTSEDAEETDYYPTNTFKITVPVPMTGLTVSPTSSALTKGETVTLTATKEPADTTDTNSVTWSSSNTSVATVNSSGVVTAQGSGTATITATCGSYSATSTITVTNPMTGLTVSESSLTLHKGNTATLTASKVPSDTDDTSAITWESSDATVATVDNGTVSAVGVGTAVITATCGTYSATCTVTVDSPLESLTLNTTEVAIDKDETYTLTATKNPSDTTDTNSITWSSSDSNVATVDENGVVTGISNGTAVVTATCGTVTATCSVTVNVHLESITIDNGNIEIKKGQTEPLSVTYSPEEFAESKTLIWTSADEGVAVVTVDNSGNTVVQAVAPGTTTITATTVNNKTASVTVTVPEVKATDLAVSTTKTTIEKGESYTLSAVVTPEDTTDTFTWSSSDETVAKVDENGVVTAVSSGTATISITSSSGLSSDCEVTVVCTLESISLNLSDVALVIGETETSSALEVTKNPTDADPDVADVVYTSSNDSVAVVTTNASGDYVIEAVGPGSAVITASLDGKTATCNVTVDVALTDVEIENGNETLTLIKNQTGTLNVIYTPSNATIIPTATWETDNINTVSVDQNGNITAVSAGTTTITVNYGNGITASRTVEVVENPSSSIVIDQNVESMNKNESVALTVTLDEGATDEIIWTSSDHTVAMVDPNGVVVALKAGTVTITASSTVSTETASLEIEIKEYTLESAKITSGASTIEEGSTTNVSVTVNPSNVTDNITMRYVSSNESVATVDENGVVKALKAGEVTITAYVTGVDGSGATTELVSSVSLTVTEKTSEAVAGTTTNSASSGDSGSSSVAATVAEAVSGVTASPHTGDMNIAGLIVLMVVSLLGMIITIKKK